MRTISLDQPDALGYPLSDRLVDLAPSVEEQAFAGVRETVITECVAQLRPRSREIITLLYALDRDPLGIEAIARQLQMTRADAAEERDYAIFQLRHLVEGHRYAHLLAA